MASSQATLKGVIRGKTIELEQEPGLPDGQSVAVTVQPLQEKRLPPGEGIRRWAGAWADDAKGLDEYVEQLRENRDQDRPPIEP
jgi:hypothetical protein